MASRISSFFRFSWPIWYALAAAGGWTNSNTLRLVYQQADQETMLQVVLEGGKLREAQ